MVYYMFYDTLAFPRWECEDGEGRAYEYKTQLHPERYLEGINTENTYIIFPESGHNVLRKLFAQK